MRVMWDWQLTGLFVGDEITAANEECSCVMENINLASVAIKIILKMYFQRGSSCDCPVQQQGDTEGRASATRDVTVATRDVTVATSTAAAHTHRGKGQHPSAQDLLRGENTPCH